MTRSKGIRPFHYKNKIPADPRIKPIKRWPPSNRGCYDGFRKWMRATGLSEITVGVYGIGARFALGYLDKPYWAIDPEEDLAEVWAYLNAQHPHSPRLRHYRKGLKKFAQYLYLRSDKVKPQKSINWSHYTAGLPDSLNAQIRAFLKHWRRRWPEERQYERAVSLLSHLTHSLRWMVQHLDFAGMADICPRNWYAYVDLRLAKGISPVTLNGELRMLGQLLRYAQDQGWMVDEKMLKVEPFPIPARIPRDVPVEQVRRLQAEIEKVAASSHAGHSRTGKLDLAWFLLMLHSGLRTGEIRRLRLTEVDFGAKKARIEQSKGLKDRFVYLSAAVIGALQDYLAVRGPVDALPEHVFIFRHESLSRTYCGSRLRTYGMRCGVRVSPHQLRHTCATLLLNAGAPVLMVQAILGHKHLDTTLQYARLYDGTVAQDYFAAMSRVEEMFSPLEKQTDAQPGQTGEVLMVLDAILTTGLSAEQVETVRVIRERVLGMVE